MKILCHVGPWSASFFETVCFGFEENSEVLLSSAHKSVDASGIATRYYDFLRINKTSQFTLSEIDRDIIARCRLLRVLTIEKAALHLNSMRDAIAEMFDRYQPELVLSETIDAYIMDLFYEECKNRNIKFIGLVTCFVNGYYRISARGEYHNLREPEEEEVKKILDMIEGKNYAPSFISGSKKQPYKSVLTRWARNCIKPPYFLLKRFLSGEKYNYHYWATQVIALQWFHLFPRLRLGQSDWEEQLKSNIKPVIYVPLQMVPEATVDYWCEDVDYIDYDTTLLKFIEKFRDDFHFLIKEHPNVLGFRNPKLYKILSSRKNVTLCPTDTGSNDIIDKFDSTLVWTGTVGFETALRGKPVIAFCKPFYASGKMFHKIGMESDANEIISFISAVKGELGEQDKMSMVRHLASGIFPGGVKFDGSWKKENKDDFSMAINLGKQIKLL